MKFKLKAKIILLSIVLWMPLIGWGATYYVSTTGSGGHDGTEGNKFTIAEAIVYADKHLDEEITMLLQTGTYDLLHRNNYQYNIAQRSAWVNWKPMQGHNVVFRRIEIDDYSNDEREATDVYFRFDGLTLQPLPGDRWAVMVGRGAKTCEYLNLTIISPGNINTAFNLWGTENIIIDNCSISGDGSFDEIYFGYGVYGNGTNIKILNSDIENCNMGIQIGGNNILVAGNHIRDVYSDGIAFSGTDITIENNEIHDLYVKDDSMSHTDLMQAYANAGTTNVIIRGNKCYNSDGQLGWINPVNGKNFIVENNLFYNSYGSFDDEHSGRILFGGIENLILRNNTIIGTCHPVNITGHCEISHNIFSNVWINESNLPIDTEEFNFVNRMGFGMYEEYGDTSFTWNENSVLVSDWLNRWNFYNPAFFDVFQNVPQFCDMVAYGKETFENVLLGEDAEGHPMLTSQEFDFDTQYVFPKYRVKVIEGKEHIEGRFQDPELNNMPVYKVEGQTIFIRNDNTVLNPGALLTIEITYTTSSETKVYYLKQDNNFEIGDIIDYQAEIRDGISHTVVNTGEDQDGKYIEITPPLKHKARRGMYISNWKNNTNVKRDFSPRLDSILCNGSHPGSQYGVAWAGALNPDGSIKSDETEIDEIIDEQDNDNITTYSSNGKLMVIYNNVIQPGKNESATIIVNIPEDNHVKIVVYDSKGNKIIKLHDKHQTAGSLTIEWSGKKADESIVGSGIYTVHMKSGSYSETKKIAVIK